MKQSSILSIDKRKQLGLPKRNLSISAMAIIVILLISIQAGKQDCDKNFVKGIKHQLATLISQTHYYYH